MQHHYYLVMTANILFTFAPFLAGALSYKYLDTASRIFWAVTALSFTGESIACYAALRYHNNLPVYAVLGTLETAGICLYFNYADDFLRKYKAGIALAMAVLLISVLSMILRQGPIKVNTGFLLAQALLICTLSARSMARFAFSTDPQHTNRFPHFWLAALLVFLWVAISVHLFYYEEMTLALPRLKPLIDGTLIGANLFYNTAIASIFTAHKRCLKYAR